MRRNTINTVFSITLLILLFSAGCVPDQKTFIPNQEPTPATFPTPTFLTETQPTEEVATAQPNPPVLPTPTLTGYHPMGEGVGIIGDSNYDEYRGSDWRGGSYAQFTYNSVELLAIHRQINFGKWGIWGEPRREGYEYNWARSSATSASMIAEGQVAGLAQQISEGKVSYVFIGIGANDFHPFFPSNYNIIYNGEVNNAQINEIIQKTITNMVYTFDTVQQAGAKKVTVILFPNWEGVPTLSELYPDGSKREVVISTIEKINQSIRKEAGKRNITVIDQLDFVKFLQTRVDENGMLHIGNEQIHIYTKGDDPHNARLGDEAGHTGTVVRGLMANFYFIASLNQISDTQIDPLTDEEILASAGLISAPGHD